MRILHVGPFRLGRASGHFNALWALARAQAARGHEVTILRVGKPVAAPHADLAREFGVRLIGFPCPRWRNLWSDPTGLLANVFDTVRPDLAHLFYVRTPKFFYIARLLREREIPYVVSLHGGMNSTEMLRRRYRKIVYWYAIEHWIHAHAAGIHFISEAELADYRATRHIERPADAVIPNIVEIPAHAPAWPGLVDPKRPKFAYFGRYDVWTKGLDLAVMLLRVLRSYGIFGELHLYGAAGDFAPELRQLVASFPEVDVVDHGFVDSPEKFVELVEHDVYLQYSRFESFGMSLAEAMAVGLPSLISERSALAPKLAAAGAAISIPMDPRAAAAVVADVMTRPELLQDLSHRGRRWVRDEWAPDVVIPRMDSFYERALAV